MTSWFVALVVGNIIAFRTLSEIKKERSFIYKMIKETPEKKEAFKSRLIQLENSQTTQIKTLIKNFADMITASAASGTYQYVNF